MALKMSRNPGKLVGIGLSITQELPILQRKDSVDVCLRCKLSPGWTLKNWIDSNRAGIAPAAEPVNRARRKRLAGNDVCLS